MAVVNMGGWQPHSISNFRTHRCGACGRESRNLEGWVWRAIVGQGRPTESLCDQCWNGVRKVLQQQPCCQRCGSTALVRDQLASGRERVTCEICAWFKIAPEIIAVTPVRDKMETTIRRFA